MANTVHKDFEPLSLKMHKHTEKVKEAASEQTVSIHKQTFKVKKKERERDSEPEKCNNSSGLTVVGPH